MTTTMSTPHPESGLRRCTVAVDLGPQSYPIYIRPGALAEAGELIKPHLTSTSVLVVSDAQVAARYAGDLVASLARAGITARVETFPAGEPAKTLATADALWTACGRARLSRQDAIIALGGGVTGDLAGFVAAGWMRGVPFIQIPTSLLAMVDSSVGGKTGVNSAAGKNLIGAFKQPQCVLIDPTLCASMDPREYRAGLAEVLKYGVIKDASFFAWQETNAERLLAVEPEAVAQAVTVSCRIKADYVHRDPFERDVRAELNYGHTFGHAIERETLYRRWLHGEAVAIGMRMAAELARRLGVLVDADLPQRQDALLARYHLPVAHRSADADAEAARLVDHCRLDKKAAGGATRFVLPLRLGEVKQVSAPDEAAVTAAFRHGMVAG